MNQSGVNSQIKSLILRLNPEYKGDGSIELLYDEIDKCVQIKKEIRNLATCVLKEDAKLPISNAQYPSGQSAIEAAIELIETRSHTIDQLSNLLTDIWKLIYPDVKSSGTWEYPGQIYNHIKIFLGEKDTAIKNLTNRLVLFEKYIRTELSLDGTWKVYLQPNGGREDFVMQIYLDGYKTEEEAIRGIVQQSAFLMMEHWEESGYFKQTDKILADNSERDKSDKTAPEEIEFIPVSEMSQSDKSTLEAWETTHKNRDKRLDDCKDRRDI